MQKFQAGKENEEEMPREEMWIGSETEKDTSPPPVTRGKFGPRISALSGSSLPIWRTILFLFVCFFSYFYLEQITDLSTVASFAAF